MVQQSPNNDSNNGNNGTVCHILPCSVEKDITAPIAQYFHPTALPPEHVMPKKKKLRSNDIGHDNDDNDDDGTAANDEHDDVTIMAAQFRGRGLLCTVDAPSSSPESCEGNNSTATTVLSKLPSNIMGVVLSQTTTATTTTTTTTSSSSNNSTNNNNNTKNEPPTQSLKMVETFQHMYNWKHEHDVNQLHRERYNNGNERYGLNAALGWCDLSHEVHDPIPVPP